MEECIEDTKITEIRKIKSLGINLTDFVQNNDYYSIQKEKDSDTIVITKITDKRKLRIYELFEIKEQIEKHSHVNNKMLLMDPEDAEKIKKHIEYCVSCQKLKKRIEEIIIEIE